MNVITSWPRAALLALVALVPTGCGSDEAIPDAAIAAVDGAPPPDARVDAAPDAAPDAECEHVLLVGGTDVAAQGWTATAQGPSAIAYGADYVELQTSTTSGASTGGALLLSYPDAVTAGDAFALEVVLRVDAVDPHDPFDSAAAILGSFTAPFGNNAQRSQMVYLDAGAVGWADDSQTAAFAVTDGAFHTYVLAVDAAGTAELSIDGTAVLTRDAFASNGTIAVGDQTNEPDVDATMRIRSVTLLCP